MKAEQYAKLKTLADRLIDQFLEEADPSYWPGAGVRIAAQTKEQRGDGLWCKKSANVTIMLVMRIDTLTRAHEGFDPTPLPAADDADPEADYRAMEKQASRILAGVQDRARENESK